MQKNKKTSTFFLVATALLTVLSIISGRLAIYIPLFGFPSVRFSLSAIPVFLAGTLFGGVYGAVSGGVSDIITFMLASSGPYHPGFTLNAALGGLLPGLFFTIIKKYRVGFSFHVVNGIAAGAALIGSFIYINYIGISDIKNLVSIAGIPANIILTVLVFGIIAAISTAIYLIEKRHQAPPGTYSVSRIAFACIVNYVMIQLCLTPIWLKQLYGIPEMASFAVRVFKSTVDIPLQVALLYLLIRYIPAKIKGDSYEL
jgi:ECF transporter S component (folate family)